MALIKTAITMTSIDQIQNKLEEIRYGGQRTFTHNSKKFKVVNDRGIWRVYDLAKQCPNVRRKFFNSAESLDSAVEIIDSMSSN